MVTTSYTPSINGVGDFRHENITPEMAGDYLQRNAHNRRVRASRVALFADLMTNGQWLLTSDAISFDINNQLQNGQHRLYAVIQSKTTQRFLVARNLPIESFAVTDIGVRRSMGDMLYIAGEETLSTEIGATLKLLWRWYEYGTFVRAGVRGARREASPQEAIDTLVEHPGIRDVMPVASKMARKFPGGVGLWGALTYLIFNIDPNAEAFYTDVYEGVGLQVDDPAYRLRERLMDRRVRLTTQETAALIIKAWRYRRDGKRIKILSWNSAEEFPPISHETEDERVLRLAREYRAHGPREKRPNRVKKRTTGDVALASV